MKKLILMLILSPLTVFANDVKLDNLLSDKNNFCGTYKDNNIKNLVQFFNIEDKSNISLNGLKVDGVLIDNPEIYLISSKEQIQNQLLKTGLQKFNEKDIKNYHFSDIKRISHKITLRFDKSLNDVEKYINKYPNYLEDKKGFANTLKTNDVINFDTAKNLDDLNNLLIKSQNGSYSAVLKEINLNNKKQTIIDYNCIMNIYK